MLLILTLAAAVSSADPTPADIAELHRIYDESCAVRAYATYDDMCDQLQSQIRQAEAEAKRDQAAEKRAARSKRPAPSATPAAGQTPAQPAPASFAPQPKRD